MKKTALRNVNIEVKQGEIFGFLGPSGSGKTTTVKILTSQLLHSVGTVKVLGKILQDQATSITNELVF